MTAHPRALVLAATPRHAEVAARWVSGDAWVVIGVPRCDGAGTEPFDGVMISGDLTDASWVSACFTVADRALGAGGTATVVLADDGTVVDDASAETYALPDDVAGRWRMTSTVVEESRTAVEFVRAAELEEVERSGRSFRDAEARGPFTAMSAGPDATPSGPSRSRTRERTRRAVRGLIRRGIGPVARSIGRRHDSRSRRLAGRLLGTEQSVAKYTARHVESRLLTMRVPVRPASNPPNLSVGVVVAATDPAGIAPWLRNMRWQHHQYWTCIVVDDASHEDTTAAVGLVRLADSRIRLARHGARRGLSAALNTGLRLLDTDLILMIDTGRPLPPTLLADAVAAFAPFLRDADVAGVSAGPATPDETRPAEVAASLAVGPVVVRRSALDAVGWFDEGIADADAWNDVMQRIVGRGFRFERAGPAIASVAAVVAGRRPDNSPSGRSSGHGAAAAAADIGFEVGRTGRLDRLDRTVGDDVLLSARADDETRRELADTAREGVRRGLADVGAAGVRSLLIEDKIWRLGEIIADEIVGSADAMPAPGGEEEDVAGNRLDVDVLLVAESVADVGPLVAVAGAADASLRVSAIDLELVDGDAGANVAWQAAGIAIVPYHSVVTSQTRPAAVVGCAPAGPAVRDLLSAARAEGSTCVLVQVPGRPATLPCSEGADLDCFPVAPDEAVRLVGSLCRDGRPARRARHRWRGTDFSALLHAEDGPLDVASIDRLAALRDRHRGETAVIVGNGPSLNETELALLTDAPTFGVNSIFLAAERFPRPITYYVVEDTSVFHENVEAITQFRTDWKFFPAMYRPEFADRDVDERTIFFRMNAGFYGRKTGTVCHPRFSLDPTQRLFTGQSVTIINLQLAHWMGFQRVVLIGMDFSYTIPDDADRNGGLIVSRSDDPNHFHPDYFGAGKSWKDPLLDRVLVNYHLAGEVYRATGREIVNATVGGQLDVFPRLPLHDALDGAPADGGR